MKKFKNRLDSTAFILLTAQCIFFVALVIITLLNIHLPYVILFFLSAGLCLSFISFLHFDHLKRKGLSKYSSEIKNMIEVVKNDKKWELNKTQYKDDLVDIYDEIKFLYDSIRKKETDRIKVLNMVNTVTSNMEMEKLFEDLMPKLIESLNSNWGAFYLANNATNKLELKSSLGFSKNIYNEFDLTIGEGLIGAAAISKEPTILRDIPADTNFVTKTFLGKIIPKNVLIVPVTNNDQLIGILSLASIYDYTNEQMEIVNMVRYYLGIALGNCVTYERTRRLTNELQFQNSLIQSLNEELENKVSDRNIFFKNIIDSIKDYSIYVIDRNGIIVEWNKGAELLFGYTEQEVKGKHINVLFSDEDVSSNQTKSRMNMVMQYGYYAENGWRHKKDGTKYYAEISLSGLYNERNELIGMTNVSKDITKLKMAENEIWFQKDFARALVESSNRALVVTDANYTVQFCNRKSMDMLGMDDSGSKNIWNFIEGEKLLPAIEKNDNGMAIKTDVRIKKSGEMTNIQINTIKDELSVMINYVFYFYDDIEGEKID